MSLSSAPRIENLRVSAYEIPTDRPESDGTLEWHKTTIVIVEARAGTECGIGYTYSTRAAGILIQDVLAKLIEDGDPMAVAMHWDRMVHAIRNLGRPGISSMAIAAVDCALWDLKARLLGISLAAALGHLRDAIPIYGSGGFTSYSDAELQEQLSGWAANGIPRVKMKVGREPKRDFERVRVARDAIGPDTQLFVDANGAYSRKQSLAMAQAFADLGVTWFEEPVSSDDLDGLRLIRDRAPAGMDVAAGEYGFDLHYFRRMLDAGSVDVLQADATRCAGVTGFMQAAGLCQARSLQLSAHCAPSIHAHPACCSPVVEHIEYFHDHVRIEQRLFDGVLTPIGGYLRPDLSRPGMGIEFKRRDAEPFAV
jgi:L-alanine-DL-glutamate epimerase-like enolase superfamily enzyme